MIQGLGGLAAVSAFAAPSIVNARSESLFGLPASDEINVIDPRGHKMFTSTQIVRKIKAAERMRSQMSSTSYFQQVGANFVQCSGGYFRGWYNKDGVIHYLVEVYDTRGAAEEAARRSLEEMEYGST